MMEWIQEQSWHPDRLEIWKSFLHYTYIIANYHMQIPVKQADSVSIFLQ